VIFSCLQTSVAFSKRFSIAHKCGRVGELIDQLKQTFNFAPPQAQPALNVKIKISTSCVQVQIIITLAEPNKSN
jgi:hypothetical protein